MLSWRKRLTFADIRPTLKRSRPQDIGENAIRAKLEEGLYLLLTFIHTGEGLNDLRTVLSWLAQVSEEMQEAAQGEADLADEEERAAAAQAEEE